MLIGAVLGASLVVNDAGPSDAAYNVAGFERGFIISDDNFYNGSAMTASQVQSFLNQKVPRCTLGDPGRAKGSKNYWAGWETKLAHDCLKTYSMKTPTRTADAYCKTYVGKNKETAAEIIANVGKACGISQKVLLVNLQKEQSLITDNWPTLKQYEIAMGYGCPDTGLNYSPECADVYFGFFNQVYNAARQLLRYKKDTSYFTWFPVKKNTNIQYGVNPQCGSKNVYIENNATAALYYYTPYTPHDNLLNGKTYNCARGSEANINFFSMYSSWFEQPNLRFTPAKQFASYRQSNSWLGHPISDAKKVTQNGGGTYQEFSGGTLFQATGGQVVGMRPNDEILKEYKRQGIGKSSWGWPVSSSGCNKNMSECATDFTNGSVVWSKLRGMKFTPSSGVGNGTESSKDIVGGQV